MKQNSMRTRTARRVIIAGLSIALAGASVPVSAYASPESELASARTRLEQIGAEYTRLQGSLESMAAELQQTGKKIEETSAQLEESKDALSRITAASYKGGDVTLAKVVLGSTSLEDLISSLYYVSKVSDAEAEAIGKVKALKGELEEQQKSQQEAMDDAQARLASIAENQAAAKALVDSLDSEVRAKLEAEASQNAQIQSGMQSAEDAQNESQTVPTPQQPVPQPQRPEPAPQPGGNGGGNGGNNGGSGNGGTVNRPSSVGSAALSIALRYEGSPYVYGGADPATGFDCSGLVMYSYAQLGISLPHDAGAQMSIVQSRGRWTTDPSQLQYGDLVFFPGHVAFYVGGGNAFGARRPGVPASTTKMSYLGAFLGGGQL